MSGNPAALDGPRADLLFPAEPGQRALARELYALVADRRVDAGFLARLVAEHRLPLDEAAETKVDLAYHLPRTVFRLDQPVAG